MTARPRRLQLLASLAVVAVLVAMIATVLVVQARSNADADLAARRAEVEQRGQHVMPFDQNRTTHAFTKTDTGGVEAVTANDAADAGQATLIQQHLQHEQELFAKGDFSDPIAIHGASMPGVAELQRAAASGELTVTYDAVPAGAHLTYAGSSPAVVEAIHQFFDAQLMDHGPHATSGG